MDLNQLQLILHYIYPLVVFLFFSIASIVVICTLQRSAEASNTTHVRYRTIWNLLLLFILSYGLQVVLKIVGIVSWGHWPAQDTTIGLLSCILVWGIQQNSLSPPSEVVWYPFYGSWLIALVFEPVIGALHFARAYSPATAHPPSPTAIILQVDGSLCLARSVLVLVVLCFYFNGRNRIEASQADEERSPLLPKPDPRATNANGSTDSGYGTNTDTNNTGATNTQAANSPTDVESPWERSQRLAREKMEKRLKDEGNWFAYVKGFAVFLPYVWPVKNRRLQLHTALVGLCLLAGNGLNFLIPRQYGAVMDSLSGVSGKNPWVQVMIFAAFRLLSSEAGLPLIRQLLWLPVEYYSQEAISIAAYSHVMNLSSEFHDTQSSSDLILAISNGQALSNLLESICFQAVPMMIDLVVAFTYLSTKFGPYEGFITVATALAFVQAASRIIARFKDKRKKMVKTFFEEHYVRQAGIQGWHTVSAFNQIPYEETRYSTALKSQISATKSIYFGYLLAHAFQYLILLAGLLAGAFLAVYQITRHQATAGDFVMLLTYWGQLTSPLRFFSQLGKRISQDFVHAERLLEVMLTKPTVVDTANAKPLQLRGGSVEFRNVNFSYDKKKDILKGVNLTVAPGATVAFVGSTGAGKSTILKLLDRFYDVTKGSIMIDNQDIRGVTLSSLRDCIGIVPQAPILFDDTVMNNIRYARLSASDEEIYEACKAAAIHEQIMGFTEGYTTRVGERGVKLSGGELQRIAIARAILKRPEIVLLDEATSSVDTETEQKIQDGLRALCQGRTTFIVAHRLSTVMNADIIYVVSGGEVVESGGHEALIAKKGKYAELWSKQIFVRSKAPGEDENTKDISSSFPATHGQLDGQGDKPADNGNAPGSYGGGSPAPAKTETAAKKGDVQVLHTPKVEQKEVDQSKDRS
ncbi:hypothetical protein F4780DRAFT_328146 [Xylariomycetidae sp. FL0641]|nr:hypothetical protein F4780DRAFT_328146 [Xylariomycetidae sp. FL0641]